MIFRQVLHAPTGCASYVFGCASKQAFAVVDPHIEHVDEYVAIANASGAKITAILETHVHADHLSGFAVLAERTGAPIYLHPASGVDGTLPFHDSEMMELGNVFVRAMHTPGHSPDSITFVVGDRTRSDSPWCVLTGDTLLVGDAGRPDLTEADADPRAAASELYDSLFRELMSLPDHIEVYPAHFSGSACGRAMSGKPSSTIGFECRFNPALSSRTREDFVDFMLRDLPPPPPGHREIRAQNTESRVPVAG